MNAFFVPQLGSMIYTMNGMVTRLNLQADKPASYRGLSAHFSGDGFSGHAFRRPRRLAGGISRLGRTHGEAAGPCSTRTATATLAQQSIKTAPFDLSAR